MAIFQDYLRDGLDGSLLIKNGDFVVGPSDEQNIHDILNDPAGFWHQYPEVGVGLQNYQNGTVNLTQLSAIIVQQLQNDGFTVKNPKITYSQSTDELDIQPNAVRN